MRLRAPADDFGVLAAPSLERVPELLARARPFRLDGDFAGADFAAVRAMARSGLKTPVIATGHQPELFHPGVWLKHFVVAKLAAANAATGVNLIVDYDTIKAPTIRVPRSTVVAFDALHAEEPYEQSTVRDEAVFASFPTRLAKATRDWPFRPFADCFWQHVRGKTGSIGERFSAARREIEADWGVRNRELTASGIADSPSFAHFAGSILLDLPRFHAAYNGETHRFRKANRIRSQNHPVPDLAHDGDWLEAPFWVWRCDSPRRGRLFARGAGDQLKLRAGTSPIPPISIHRFAQTWPSLRAAGWKIRLRALTNTLYARLFLADLFIHGIGGGIYDELTDAISAAYFGAAPPMYMVVSGTLRLGLPLYAVSIHDRERALRDRRDRVWNPQRWLGGDAIAERQRLIDLPVATRRQRRERFVALRRNLEQLQAIANVSTTELERIEFELLANDLLGSREHSFVLHSEERLKRFLSN